MHFDMSALGAQQKYRLLSGGVTPRPIAWISTRSVAGIDNLAPYSFFTVASCNPPVLLYTQVTPRSGIDKDTLTNLRETGECVVNIVNSHLLDKMNVTAVSVANDENEFALADVEQIASANVSPCSVLESPIRYECRLREVISLGNLPTGGTVVLLDVKSVYVRDDLYSDEGIDQTLIDSVGKMGGDGYSLTSDVVTLKRS